jgi:hypothetical protein
MVASDVQLANAMEKIPSEKLVTTLFETTKSQEWSTLLVLGDALLVLDNDSSEDEHALCATLEEDSIDGMDESVPDALEASSVKSSSDEENDDFDMEGLPMPRINSSTAPFVVEVSPRNGRFASKDPLFQGVCLYSGSMTSIEVEAYSSTLEINSKKKDKQKYLTNSWFLPSSIFQYLLTKQYAHATHCQSETST